MSSSRYDLTLYRALKALVFFSGGELEIEREKLIATDEYRLSIQPFRGGHTFKFEIVKRDQTQGGQNETRKET